MAFVAVAWSQKYLLKQPNHLTTEEKLLNDVRMINDSKESDTAKKKTTIDYAEVVTKSSNQRIKYDTKDARKFENKILSTVIDVELEKLEAIRTIKLALLNLLSTEISALIDEIQNTDVIDLLDSPIFNFVTEILAPLISGKNSEKDGTNVRFPDLQSDDSVWSQKDLKTSMIHEDIPGKSTLASMETLFQEPLPESS